MDDHPIGGIDADGPPDDRAARLTRALARGDRAAFDELYRDWFDRVYRGARAATGRDESFCLDVVQDVMLRVIRSMKPLRGHRELKAWMGLATISCAIDALRREQRRARRERAVGADPAGAGADDAAAINERVDWLRAQLAGMDPDDRDLLGARFARGATLRDAGHAAGVSGDAAHGRLRRLLRSLALGAKEMLP